MTNETPMLTEGFWRSRRSAAIAGILFGVLLLTAMAMLRLASSEGSRQSLQSDAQRCTLTRWSLNLVPFAGIAFLWFIGVVPVQLGDIEDRLFSTVFLGSGLLFLAMLFVGAGSEERATALPTDCVTGSTFAQANGLRAGAQRLGANAVGHRGPRRARGGTCPA